MIEENEFAGRDGKVSRRTIVKGAAWSVPVVAMAAAVPMASASTVACPPSQTVRATDAGQGTLSVAVPPQVKTIRYTIAGGRGDFTAGGPEGLGALFNGEIPVSALGGATTIQLIAGQKGMGATGGKGFGNGGNGNRTGNGDALGGGAGSAILVGASPLVVAGGGGGSGRITVTINGSYTFQRVSSQPTGEGWGGLPGSPAAQGVGFRLVRNSDQATIYTVTGGEAAQQSRTGVPGAVSGTTPIVSLGSSGNGRNGGDGGFLTDIPSGGGGGGYFGGGGGSAVRSDNSAFQGYNAGSMGGGGSSFTADGITWASTGSANTDHGYVTVEFVC